MVLRAFKETLQLYWGKKPKRGRGLSVLVFELILAPCFEEGRAVLINRLTPILSLYLQHSCSEIAAPLLTSSEAEELSSLCSGGGNNWLT